MPDLSTPKRGDNITKTDVASHVWMEYFEDITDKLNDFLSCFSCEIVEITETITTDTAVYTAPKHTKAIIQEATAKNNNNFVIELTAYVVLEGETPDEDNKVATLSLEPDVITPIKELEKQVLFEGDFVWMALSAVSDITVELNIKEVK